MHWLLGKQEHDWKEWEQSGYIFQEMCLYTHVTISTFKWSNTSWNITRFEIMHVSVCHWVLRSARHLMWEDFVLKQSNVNPDAFESRDINPTPLLPISWAVGLETMRESEMTGERATVLFCITYSANWAWWLSLHFTQTVNSHTWPFSAISEPRSPTLYALVKFSIYLNGC